MGLYNREEGRTSRRLRQKRGGDDGIRKRAVGGETSTRYRPERTVKRGWGERLTAEKKPYYNFSLGTSMAALEVLGKEIGKREPEKENEFPLIREWAEKQTPGKKGASGFGERPPACV